MDAPEATLPDPPPLAEDLTPPSALYRWLGAVPMFVSFSVVAWSMANCETFVALFREQRFDLPVVTRLAIRISRFLSNYYILMMPGMLGLSGFYFSWCAKTRERLQWFSLATFAIGILMVLVFIGGWVLPWMKIQDVLRAK